MGWFPQKFLQPVHPVFLERVVANTGMSAWVYRTPFILCSLFCIVPILSLLVLLSEVLPARLRPLGYHPDWVGGSSVIGRTWVIAVVRQLFWAITSWGSPPNQDLIATPSKAIRECGKLCKDGYRVTIETLQVHTASREACMGALAMDGLVRQDVSTFWLRREVCKVSTKGYRLFDGRCILYLVGGGYGESWMINTKRNRGELTQGLQLGVILLQTVRVLNIGIHRNSSSVCLPEATWALCRKLGLPIFGASLHKPETPLSDFGIICSLQLPQGKQHDQLVPYRSDRCTLCL